MLLPGTTLTVALTTQGLVLGQPDGHRLAHVVVELPPALATPSRRPPSRMVRTSTVTTPPGLRGLLTCRWGHKQDGGTGAWLMGPLLGFGYACRWLTAMPHPPVK